jgi:protein TonB
MDGLRIAASGVRCALEDGPLRHGPASPLRRTLVPARLVLLLAVILAHAGAGALLLMPRTRAPAPALAPAMEAQLLSDHSEPARSPVLPPPTLEQPPIEVIRPEVSIDMPAELPTALHLPAPAAPAARAAPDPGPDDPVTAPRFDAAYLKNPAPAYPASSRRLHEQGTVLLRVRVSAQGAPVEVLVDGSSGSSRLDEAAVTAVRQWRFVPAQRGAASLEAWVLIPLAFELRRQR